MFLFFLSSGLFLGWSLGANDAANVFGTAVGSRMIGFKKAALLCSISLILGAVISGSGASGTLGRLGAVNAIAGAFIVALAAAISVYIMTMWGYPVSTSQGIVGAIIGWNIFTGTLIDYTSLTKIVFSWVACPVLSALLAIVIYKLTVFSIKISGVQMFRLDTITRYGLVLAGIFGAYSLGANNIANVMGVFVPVSPFKDVTLMGILPVTSAQQLFLIGGIAIAAGVFTYSKRVIMTVGTGIMKISPVAAFVAVWSHSIVLFLFASEGLEQFLATRGIPPIPLVPVSSSQAIVGAIIGIGFLKGGKGIRWRTVGGISIGWIATPVLAALVSFISLFVFQNVFQQKTYDPVEYLISFSAIERIEERGAASESLETLMGRKFTSAFHLKRVLETAGPIDSEDMVFIMESTEFHRMKITKQIIRSLDGKWFTNGQIEALNALEGSEFIHKWMLNEALANMSPSWRMKSGDTCYNSDLGAKLSFIHDRFIEPGP